MRDFLNGLVLSFVIFHGVSGPGQVRGDSISTLASTGQGLSTGVVDPNFTIVSAPSGATLNPDERGYRRLETGTCCSGRLSPGLA